MGAVGDGDVLPVHAAANAALATTAAIFGMIHLVGKRLRTHESRATW
jgi:hypothetical protein